MSKLTGPLTQNAFIVRDLEAAITYWTEVIGAGPFFVFPPLEFSAGTLHGAPLIPRFKAAIAYSGDLNIELIEPEGPSIFQEFLDAGGTGVHHNCVMTEDFDTAVASYVARGGEVVQTQDVADGSRLAYVQMHGAVPVIIEVAYLKPAALGLFAALREAAANWDGKTRYLTF
ncbi:glyoxalase [Acidocella aquatica]|uniref:Glyoxalase n=1 Tax=Acidocella aquatica TaxID=1922313 RepID=A0ABQ6AA80_9PROT|nr:VOC family protein [Acidocella aquatica]GLR67143.1 glyoxalase [Acidocella aquatica]